MSAASTPHPMRFRILWTWDSWVCDPFSAESYISEYCDLIDFLAANEYNGLVIWGFIDSRHGGEEAAREIASYGARAGVRIIPGVGAGGYEGFVTSGDHEFSISRLLAKRPDLRAHPRCSPEQPSDEWLCLYHTDAVEWLRAGARWLAENFEIGGINIETNESDFIDVCCRAEHATAVEPNRLKFAASFYDLSLAVPAIHDEISRIRPDAWVTYATYEPPWWRRREDIELLQRIPPECAAQWNVEMEANTSEPSPLASNISLIHSGGWSYHLGDFPPQHAFTQHRCFFPNLEEAREFARNQRAMRVQGFSVGCAGSHKCPDNEIAYRAFVEFARNPDLTLEEFSREHISEIYGARAEPMVRELILRQPGIHRSVVHAWRARVSGDAHEKITNRVSKDDVSALEEQIKLALLAHDAASEGGAERLDKVIAVLKDYLDAVRPGEQASGNAPRRRE